MTARRDDDHHDQLVSQTYRELSVEKVPPHLDREVLRAAATERPHATSIATQVARWTRPLALAATFALSLAVVFEYSKLPEPSVDASSPAPNSVSSEFRPNDNSAIEEAQNQARLRSGPNRPESFGQLSAEDKTQGRQDTFVAPAPAAEPLPDLQKRSKTNEVAVVAEVVVPVTATQGDTASPRSADAAVAGQFSLSSLVTTADKTETDDAQYCDDDVRASQDDWMACIEELRAADATAAADQEYQQLLLAFPRE